MIVDRVETINDVFSTTTFSIPNDDTIPQITEGTEFITLDITPKKAGNIIRLEAFIAVYATNAVTVVPTAALFNAGSGNDAIQAIVLPYNNATLLGGGGRLLAEISAIDLTTLTLSLRCGNNTTNVFAFNGHGDGVCA